MSHIRTSLLLRDSSSSASIWRIFLSRLLRRILFLKATRSCGSCCERWNYNDILLSLSWSQICRLLMNLFIIFRHFCIRLLHLWIALIMYSFWWHLVLYLRLLQLIARQPTNGLVLSRRTHRFLWLAGLSSAISTSNSLLLALLASFLVRFTLSFGGAPNAAGASAWDADTTASWACGRAKRWCSHHAVASCRRSSSRLLLCRISFMAFCCNVATFGMRFLLLLRTWLSSIWCG